MVEEVHDKDWLSMRVVQRPHGLSLQIQTSEDHWVDLRLLPKQAATLAQMLVSVDFAAQGDLA